VFLKTIAVSAIVLLLPLLFSSARAIDFFVLNMKGNEETKKQWSPLTKYLENQIKKDIYLHLLPNAAFVKRAIGREILLTNPVNAVILEDTGEFEIVATLNHVKQGSNFAGVIIVHQDSNINHVKQLAGKQVGVVNKKFAAGGFLFQANELLKHGMVASRDVHDFKEIFNQKAIVLRVLNKQLDAGFIRTGMLESLQHTKNIDQLKILNRMNEGLIYPRSTAIYPHWAILINRKVPTELRNKIVKSLLSIKSDSNIAKIGKMKGFVLPEDYNKVKNVMRRMKSYEFTKDLRER